MSQVLQILGRSFHPVKNKTAFAPKWCDSLGHRYSDDVLSVNTPELPVAIITFSDIRMGLFTSAKFLSRRALPHLQGRWEMGRVGPAGSWHCWTLQGAANSSAGEEVGGHLLGAVLERSPVSDRQHKRGVSRKSGQCGG